MGLYDDVEVVLGSSRLFVRKLRFYGKWVGIALL